METYYQYLFDVPVEKELSSYSTLNEGTEWGLNTRDFLINEGEGWNYGVEFTLEKFYHNNYYFLVTTSLFDSKYTGSDGIKRNTAFNGKFVFNTLAGREFKLKKNATLVFDIKGTWAGGKRYTPIDVEASKNSTSAFSTEYFENLAYSQQFSNYFKADVKIGFRKDGKKVSQVWEFYVENITNHKNPFTQLYSKSKGEKSRNNRPLRALPDGSKFLFQNLLSEVCAMEADLLERPQQSRVHGRAGHKLYEAGDCARPDVFPPKRL